MTLVASCSPEGTEIHSTFRDERLMEIFPDANSKAIPARVRLAIEQDGKCRYCGDRFSLSNPPTLEHLLPKSRGGLDISDNCAATCVGCNNEKGSLDDDEYRVVRSFRSLTPEQKREILDGLGDGLRASE